MGIATSPWQLVAGAFVLASALALPPSVSAANPDRTVDAVGQSPQAPPVDAAVLVDQIGAPGGNSTSSQNFEAANDAFDDFLADDFVVPLTAAWRPNLLEVVGVYFNGAGPAASVNVWIYENGNGAVPNVPSGPAVYTGLSLPYTNGPSFVIDLPNPVTLCSGHYWVVVQANQDFSPAGQWGWTDRTVLANDTAAWQNPGGGFGVCPTWNRKLTCIPTASGPDQEYRLRGDVLAPCATPVEPATWGRIKALYP